MRFTLALVALCATLLQGCLGDGLTTGQYLVMNKGRDLNSCAVDLLGFNNRSCEAGTKQIPRGKDSGPSLRAPTASNRWATWTVTVTKELPGGAVEATLSVFVADGAAQPLCVGNLVAEKPAACADPRAHIHPAAQTGAGVPWVLTPVGDAFTIAHTGRAEGCAAYLTAQLTCSSGALGLAPAEGSQAQEWVLQRVGPASSPPPPPPPPLAGQPPGLTVAVTGTTTALATVIPPPGGCSPVSYEVSHARANSLEAPSVASLPHGALTVALGNLQAGVTYAATVVGVCPDGTRTPPSAPARFTTFDDCKPTLSSLSAANSAVTGKTSYACADPRAFLILKCVSGSVGACGDVAAAESPEVPPPGGVDVTTSATLTSDQDYTCFTVARNAGGNGALCSDPVSIKTTSSDCFPGAATVHVRGRGATRMDALRVGDAVLSVGYSGLLEFQEVYFMAFGRRRCVSPAQRPSEPFTWYHSIQATSGVSPATLDLRVSSRHFVPVTLDAAGWCNASAAGGAGVAPPSWASHTMLVAKDVKPSMVVWHTAPGADAVGGAPSPACVTANRAVIEHGAFAPYVRARALVVDSVVASPHIRWNAFALNWILPASLQLKPAATEIFMTPIFWLHRAMGGPALEVVCSTGVAGYCPGGLWDFVGVNVLLVFYVALAACVASAGKRAGGFIPGARKLKSA